MDWSAIASPRLADDRFHDFDEKADAVLRRAAITIRPPIAAIAQKLVDQIAIGAVQFDAVEPGIPRIVRRLPVVLDNAGDFLRLERARRDEWFQPLSRHRLTRRSNCRWRHRQRAVRLQ